MALHPMNASIQGHLSDVLRLAAGRRTVLASLAVQHKLYARWARVLLDTGIQNWRSALTSSQVKSLFDCHFVNVAPLEAFEALAKGLNATASDSDDGHDGGSSAEMERRAAVMAKLLVAMVKAKRLRALVADHVRHGCTSAAVDHEQESSAIVSLLVTLPSRVANALRAAPPSVLSHDSFYRILTSDMLHALVSEASSAQGASCSTSFASPLPQLSLSPRARAFVGAMLGRIARLGHFHSVIPLLLSGEGVCQVAASNSKSGGDQRGGGQQIETDRLAGYWGGVLAAMPPASVEAALEASVRLPTVTSAQLGSLYLPLLRSSSAARLALSERALLRVLPNQCVPRIISLLSELTLGSKDGARPHSGMLLDCLRSVAEVWSGSSHVRSAPLRTQRYLTQLLVEGIPALRPTTLASELVHVLLSGVQHHLQAPMKRIVGLACALPRLCRASLTPTIHSTLMQDRATTRPTTRRQRTCMACTL